GHDHIADPLELIQITHHPRAMEAFSLQHRLIHHHLHPAGLDALHHALDGGGAEVVRAGFHYQAVDTHHSRPARKNGTGDEVLAGGVGLDDGPDQVIRHLVIVGQQLTGVLGQTIAAVTETGVVVVLADTRVQAYPLDHLPTLQAPGFAVAVEFVEVGHAHRQVSV